MALPLEERLQNQAKRRKGQPSAEPGEPKKPKNIKEKKAAASKKAKED